MPTESSIVASILKRLNTISGVRAVKRHGSPFSRKGEPDIDCVVRTKVRICGAAVSVCFGVSVKLEVKRPGEKPTAIQELEMQKWRDVGCVVAVVSSAIEAEKIVRNLQGDMG